MGVLQFCVWNLKGRRFYGSRPNTIHIAKRGQKTGNIFITYACLYYCEIWCLSVKGNWLRAGRSGNRIPVGARFSTPVQTGPGAHPASCTVGTWSFQGVKSGRGVALTPHSLLVPWSRKTRAIPLLPLLAVRPVPSLSACTRVQFTFTFTVRKTEFAGT